MKKNLVFAFSAVLLFMTVSSFAQKNNTSVMGYHPNKYMFPENFNPEKHVLLVMQLPKRNKPDQQHKAGTNEIENVFKNRYGAYQFQIIAPIDISADSTKYADLGIYRFILYNTATTTGRVDGGYTIYSDGTRTPNLPARVATTTIDFYFYDRLTKTAYPSSELRNSILSMTLGPIVSTIVENAKLKKE